MDAQQPQALDPDLVAVCPLWAMHRPELPDVLGELVDPYFVVRVDAETIRNADGEARRFDASLTMEEIIELAVPADGQEHLIRLDLRDRQGPRANGRVGYIPKQAGLRVPARQVIRDAQPEAREPESIALSVPGGDSIAWYRVQTRAFESVDAATKAAVEQVVKIAETYRADSKDREANMLNVVNKALHQTGETQRQLVALQERIGDARVEIARASAAPGSAPTLNDHITGIVTNLAPVVSFGSDLMEMAGGWDGIKDKLGTLAAGAAAKESGAAFAGIVETVKDMGGLWMAQKMGLNPGEVEPPDAHDDAAEDVG